MQAMVDELAQAVSPGAHAMVLMDRAGWHMDTSKNRVVGPTETVGSP
jgi:hypothetical protein